MGALRQESALIWHSVKFVCRAYIVFPKRAAEIFYAEALRLYAKWLGIPPPDRIWEFKGREEL